METILIVDDNEDLQFNLYNIISSAGYNAITAGEGERALKEVASKSPDLVLLDMKLPGMDGITILKKIKQTEPATIVIILTAYGDLKVAVNAMKLGAYDFITKPFDNDALLNSIKHALDTKNLSRQVETLKKQLAEKNVTEELIGVSDEYKQVLKQVKIIAPTNMTVMIQGESGTGKEIIARMLHRLSMRSDKIMVAVDCGAIPDTLVESELFGHEKGAFTGADNVKEGKFEQANGGTLFLDELTNLTEANQMKLLRVLEERKLQKIGGKKLIDVDVRIIAACNVKLSDAVREGKFRSDLYYRLNEFHINIPLLKDRKDDIPVLTKHFIDNANNEFSKSVKSFDTEAAKMLFNYNWPGNVRELKNAVRRAVLLAEGDFITTNELSIDHTISPAVNSHIIDPKNISLDDATKHVEKEMIIKALEQTSGNKIKAAKMLNMNRKTLYRKIKTLELDV